MADAQRPTDTLEDARAALAATRPGKAENVRGDDGRSDVEDWLHRSYATPDAEAALEFAQRAADLEPDDRRVQDTVQRTIVEQLNHDAFIGYLAETDKNYVIHLRASRPLTVPKGRVQPDRFPPETLSEPERLLRALRWMLLGLLPVGLGALVLSPILVGRAVRLLGNQSLGEREQRLCWLIISLAVGLGFLGGLFTLLLALRLGG